MTPQERRDHSAEIIRQLAGLSELRRAEVVMAFAPLSDEADIFPLLEDLMAMGKTIVFPVLVGQEGRMDAHRVEDLEKDLKRGKFGIFQPANGVPIDPREIDFMLVPAVAFDDKGHRLGRGGGYYDRFLSARAVNAFTCGVAYECQVHESIPLKEHDCAVEALATEKRIRRFPKG